MRRYAFLAFVIGAAIMVGEIAAVRAIAPHFGTSIVVWTNVIGIILVALSLGYWLGGRLSVRRSDERILGGIIALAGVLLLIPAFATRWIAGSLIVDTFRFGSGFAVVLVGSFLTVVLLFALPILLLGMVSPFLIQLACQRSVQSHKMSKVELRTDVGAVAGRLYAISTLGSLVGTFLPTLVLLPLLGTRRTILSAAMVLILLGGSFMSSRRRAVIASAMVLAFLALSERPLPWFLGGMTLAQEDSRYQLLRIVDRTDGGIPERLLVFNEGFGVQSKAVFADAIPDGYFSVAAAMPGLLPHSPAVVRVLVLGNAGGTLAHLIERFFPDTPLDITGVELDPAVTAITAAYFPPPPRPYAVIHADSRVFLQTTDARYDVIVADAYTNQLTIPPHLASIEFFTLLRDHLTPSGILVANVNAPRADSRLLRIIAQTIASVFPHVIAGQAGETWNVLLLASDTPIALDRLRTVPLQEIAGFLANAHPVVRDPQVRVFTDDWAPIELLTDVEIFDTLRTLVR